MTLRVRKAVIPVAGLGTRMLPATKVVPKELVTVAGKPSVQWVVEAAVASGIEEIILVTAPGKSAIADHFAPAPQLESHLEARGKRDLLDLARAPSSLARITCVVQAEPLGLGHAVLMAKDAVGDEPFAVLLADEILHGATPSLAQCLDAGSDFVLGLAPVPRDQIRRYGIVSISRRIDERTVEIDGMVEKPEPDHAPSDLAITGNPYVLPSSIFAILEKTERGASGEIQLTDALRVLATQTRCVGRIVQGERLDVGNPLGFVQANVAKALDDPALGPALREWLRTRLD